MTGTVFDTLREHEFFADLSDEDIGILSACATPAAFAAGQVIFREGGPADACYLILRGDVALEVTTPGRGAHVVQTLHGGDILGWSWLFPPRRWMFDAQALTDTAAIRLDARCLRAAIDADHEFGYQLLQRFSQVMTARLQAARLQLMDVYGAP